jgi:hypothetical protein
MAHHPGGQRLGALGIGGKLVLKTAQEREVRVKSCNTIFE